MTLKIYTFESVIHGTMLQSLGLFLDLFVIIFLGSRPPLTPFWVWRKIYLFIFNFCTSIYSWFESYEALISSINCSGVEGAIDRTSLLPIVQGGCFIITVF